MIASFETPPEFELWNNPVTLKAMTFDSLGLSGGRSLIADEIFRNCNAHHLCDDGCRLVDGGINHHRRLWLTYQFNSLTDYDNNQNYTSIDVLVSVIVNDQHASEVFFGFDWKRQETLSRLMFDETDATLKATVLVDDAWHSVHRLEYRRITM